MGNWTETPLRGPCRIVPLPGLTFQYYINWLDKWLDENHTWPGSGWIERMAEKLRLDAETRFGGCVFDVKEVDGDAHVDALGAHAVRIEGFRE